MKIQKRITKTGTIEYTVTKSKSYFFHLFLFTFTLLILKLRKTTFLFAVSVIAFGLLRKSVQDTLLIIPKIGIVVNGRLLRNISYPLLNEVQSGWTFKNILFLHSKTKTNILFPVRFRILLTLEY